MEEFTILQSMLNILNSNNSKNKKAIIEALPVLLDTINIYEESEVYNLIVLSAQNLCFQIINTQLENPAGEDSVVPLDNLKSMFTYFINIIKKHSNSDIIQLFQKCLEFSYKVNYQNSSNEHIRNIGFCVQNLYVLCSGDINDNTHLKQLKNVLINILYEQNLKKNKLDVVLMILNNIVSAHDIPTLWIKLKPMVKTHPEHVIYLFFNMQCLFFNSMCVSIILNDDDFWSLLCSLLTCENNIIRTYNNVILKLSCSLLSNENVTYCSNKSKEQFMKVFNDYIVIMETLENTQQHLTLPILNTAKKLALDKTNNSGEYELPLKWITAMYCKMSKHSSKYVILASIDIITNMSIISLKTNEKLLQSFINSLNNVFLYKMPSELYVDQPQLETILTLWFDKLIMSSDGHDVFGIFLTYIPTVKWSFVPLIFLTKSLANISTNSTLKFNIIDHVLKIKYSVMKMPNCYLKNVVLSFLFTFTCKCFINDNTQFSCDLFDCIVMYEKNKKSWDYIKNSVGKINDLSRLDKQLSQHIDEKLKMYSTSIGLLVLSDIFDDYPVCVKMLDDICSSTKDISDVMDFLECLLEVESCYNRYNTFVSQVLNKHIWSLITLWIDKCLVTLEEGSCDDSTTYSFFDKILSSNRIPNTKTMNKWLEKCNSILVNRSGNYSVLTIYGWIGKYATKYSAEHTLKNDWLSFTKHFINSGFFSLHHQDFYLSKKPRMHKIPQLDIINTFFQYSTVSDEQMLDIFEWLTEKTVERYDNYWSIYFLTVHSFLCKFSIQMHVEKIIQFIRNCWEFLINCRVSCFPSATKSFVEMAFHYKLLSEETYLKFVKNEIIQNILTEKYSEKFNVCFSLFLLKFFERDLSNNIIQNLELQLILCEFFAKCILFNIDRYGATKIEWDTIEYVRSLNDFPLIDDILIECLPDDRYLRCNTIKCLHKFNSNMLWKNVLNIVIKTESSLRDKKYFHNSKAYRIKQRIVHVLLIIACDKKHKSLIFENNVYKWSLSSLKEVSHIHSVAYQLIWLLVLIYNKYQSYSDFWNDYKSAQENNNYLCSFISILYHLHKIKENNQFEIDTKKHLLPLCFSNGYKVRFYAQTTLCKLFPCNSEDSEWSLLWDAVNNILVKYELTKKYENPFHDFFYGELHMINSLCLQNVCVEVPRLLNIVYEERFPLKWLNNFSVTINNNNNKYDLSMCTVSSFIEKNTTSASLNDEIIIIDNVQNAQRKYIPSQPQDEGTSNSMLIVVASLIDKATNLGGLARTCQVFGTSTLVVDNLLCVEKKEFTALSMTAEKHQNITEVKLKSLKSYLQKKKSEGYQIVAAEQTVDSVKLHNTKLPFKCVLLLGNEISGIPHDLLSIMDTCVEIEQLGIVRSLNVHVAGSLFIWEYAKQHCLNISN